ncbi:carbohydrate kinase family protein [bacterium]|nr:carbohydrate kinase family protein [bacterium]
MNNKKILVTGSMAYDRIMNFPGYFKDNIMPDQIHNLNISFFVNEFRESYGGTAGNIAYNLGLLQTNFTTWVNVGDDFKNYQKWFLKNNIDISQIKIFDDQKTAFAYIITDQADNQIASFFPGAMMESINLQPISLKNVALAIISAQNPIDMVELPLLFKENEIPYIFDPGQQVTSLNGEQLKQSIRGSKILIGNDYEIKLIQEKTKWTLENLREETEILIITLGEKGSQIYTKNQKYDIKPAEAKNSSDPTGAGDAYRAGLIKGLIEKWPMKKIGRFAGLISVYTVEKYGTQTHEFTWAELEKRYQQNFKEKL